MSNRVQSGQFGVPVPVDSYWRRGRGADARDELPGSPVGSCSSRSSGSGSCDLSYADASADGCSVVLSRGGLGCAPRRAVSVGRAASSDVSGSLGAYRHAPGLFIYGSCAFLYLASIGLASLQAGHSHTTGSTSCHRHCPLIRVCIGLSLRILL